MLDYRDAAATLDRLDALPRAARSCRLQTAGYDGVPERMPAGVTLSSAVGVHDDATAELALGMVLAVLRGTVEAVRAGRGPWGADARTSVAGRRSRDDPRLRLDRSRGRRTPAADEGALTASPSPPHGRPGGRGARLRRPGGATHQDVVIVLVPHNERTEKLVDAGLLAKMADGSLLVNVARGAVVDTDAVLAEAGRLRFALDVTDPEPLPDAHPLFSAPEVLITPHVAGGTTAMLPRMAALLRDQLDRRPSPASPSATSSDADLARGSLTLGDDVRVGRQVHGFSGRAGAITTRRSDP